MKLELFYYNQCPFCFRVVKAIDELGLQEKITFRNVLDNPQDRKYHMDQTGRTTVPCLYVDDKPMFESADIIQWLKDKKSEILGA